MCIRDRGTTAVTGSDSDRILSRRLDNGILVLVQEAHHSPMVSMLAGFKAGVRYESEQTNGLSNFTAAMLAVSYTHLGKVYQDDFPLYYRPLAIDDAGWIYGGIAIKAAQVVGFNIATGESRTFIPEEQRQEGAGSVSRGADGKVYATAPGWGNHVLYDGVATPVEKQEVRCV